MRWKYAHVLVLGMEILRTLINKEKGKKRSRRNRAWRHACMMSHVQKSRSITLHPTKHFRPCKCAGRDKASAHIWGPKNAEGFASSSS